MLKVIIEKEIREILGSAKFSIIFGVCALLTVGAFYAGAVRYHLNRSQYEASVAENLRRYDGVTDWIEVQDSRAFLPPTGLAALVSGVDNDIGRSVTVSGLGELVAEGSRYNEDPLFAIFRFLDLEFIFGIILSLVAILLCYNAISGEKEQGTLRLTFAQPVPRSTYILGKLLGSFIALSAAILLTMAIGCLVFMFMEVPMTAGEWWRLILIIGIGLLHFGVFLCLAVFVSALTTRSSNSLLLLLAVWIGCVLIIPRISVLTSGQAVDVPSADELATEKATYSAELQAEFTEAMTNFDPAGREGRIEEKFMQFMDSLNTAREEKMSVFAARLNEERRNRQEVQQRLALGMARLSPTAAMALATASLAGTSVDMGYRFVEQTRAFQTQFAEFTKEKTGLTAAGFRMVRIGGEDGQAPEKPKSINVSEIPVFVGDSHSSTGLLGAAAMDVGLLILFTLVFFVGAFVAFLKYDLR
jgi:ABC-type transport system involved in multi-copper enzyme maturation permease subunit